MKKSLPLQLTLFQPHPKAVVQWLSCYVSTRRLNALPEAEVQDFKGFRTRRLNALPKA